MVTHHAVRDRHGSRWLARGLGRIGGDHVPSKPGDQGQPRTIVSARPPQSASAGRQPDSHAPVGTAIQAARATPRASPVEYIPIAEPLIRGMCWAIKPGPAPRWRPSPPRHRRRQQQDGWLVAARRSRHPDREDRRMATVAASEPNRAATR